MNSLDEYRFNDLLPLYDSLAEGICFYRVQHDAAGAVTGIHAIEVNAAFESITGISREKILSDLAAAIGTPADGALLRHIKTARSNDRESVELFCSVTQRTFKVTTAVFSGDLRAVVIEDRSRLTDAIRKPGTGERRHEEFFNRYPFGLVISRIDNGRMLRCNDYIARMLGYSSREECLEQYSTGKHYVHPDDRKRFLRILKERGMVEDFEVELRDCNGKRLWVSYNARIEGDVIEGAALVITGKKHTESRLQESEERYRRLANATYEAVVISCKGVVVDVSPQYEAMYGYTKQEVMTMDVTRLIHPDDRDLVILNMRNNVVKGPYRHRGIRKDGTTIHLEARADTVHIDGMEHRLTVLRDISELISVQEQLVQSEKMRAIGQLAGGIAHDFNNQLAGILGLTELLHQELKNFPELRTYTVDIMNAGKRSADLTAQLLAFARKGNYLARHTDLHEIIGEVIGILQRTIDRRIRIHDRLEAEKSIVRGDPTQLQNAVMNIALNARDAMPDGGELTIYTSNCILDDLYCRSSFFDIKPSEYIRIHLHDTGTGMSPEIQKRIFEPFFTTKNRGEGAGMGLASVYGTLKNHNGEITVRSSPEAGTTFMLLLPLSETAEKSAPASTDDVKKYPAGSSRILLVDDEAIVRTAATALLKKAGYTILQSTNGQEALAVYSERWREIDLVLLDMIMPVVDGRETFFKLKKINPQARIILLSGYSMEGEAQQLVEKGAVDFIRKPFSRETLYGKIQAALTI